MTSIPPKRFRQRAEHVKKHAVCATKRASRIKVHSLHAQFKGLASKLRCSILTTESKVSPLSQYRYWQKVSFPLKRQIALMLSPRTTTEMTAQFLHRDCT
jgi:hypothetical protein